MEVEIGMKPGTMICICYDNITRDLPSSIGQEFATSMKSAYGNRVEQEKTHSKVRTTRSPFGSGLRSTVTLQSIIDMIPSPNYEIDVDVSHSGDQMTKAHLLMDDSFDRITVDKNRLVLVRVDQDKQKDIITSQRR